MIVGILSALFLCAMPMVSLYVWKLAWRDGVSLYDRLGFFQIPFGENARSGIDASVPISGLVAGSGFAVVGVLAAPELMEVSVPLAPCRRGGPGPDRDRPGVGGFALGLSLLLFLFPRALAPPYARDKRGWVPEWLHQMSRKHAQRRPRTRRSR
ncbi:MAG TPA: hypothetical protein VFI21_03045 [Nocardioides sp.]|jgi:hypothetical protein|nr:hypothetical protein [Nocardioides sp.]